MAIPARFGGVTRLDTSTSGQQDLSSVAVLRDGSIVVSWTDYGSTSGDIRYRQFDLRGTPTTATERTANLTTTGAQEDAQVAALSGGGFALVWTTANGASLADVAARSFTAAGLGLSGQIAVAATIGNQREAAITGTANGGFVVGWEENNAAVSGINQSAVLLRGYGLGGAALGTGPLVVSGTATPAGGDTGVALAANAAGVFAVWQDALPPDFAQDGIYGRGFAGSLLPASVPGEPEQVDGGPLTAAMTDPDFALLTNGDQVAVWSQQNQNDPNFRDIWMRTETGTARVNTTLASNQQEPAIAALAGGGFVVVWEDYSSGGANADIRARVYDAAGVATSNDFIVPDAPNAVGQQFNPDVAGLIDGRFIVTWSTLTFSGGSNLDIAAQIFDPRTGPQTWLGGTAGERYLGTAFGDSLNGGVGNDRIEGQGGNDTLIGSFGNDTLEGGIGIDRLFGSVGDDLYVVEGQADQVIEGLNQGIDTIRVTGGAAYTIVSQHVEALVLQGAVVTGTGNALGNTITGNGVTNVLRGLGGADTLLGGLGNDVLIGGTGADSLVGGAGQDQYRLLAAAESTPAGRDTIAFSFGGANGIDRIDLRAIDANEFLGGDDAFVFIGAAPLPGGGAAGAGRLRAAAAGPGQYVVQADTNGDGVAEIEMLVQSATAPVAGWFLA
jgi:Ca2+-binding RTX toxin-like protein